MAVHFPTKPKNTFFLLLLERCCLCWATPLRTINRAVAEERNNAAKYRDKPKTKYGNAQKRVKHLVPDLLVGRPLVGEEGKKGRHE